MIKVIGIMRQHEQEDRGACRSRVMCRVSLGEEVDEHDLHAVERVVQHRGDQSELEQPHERVVVDGRTRL